MPPYSPVPAPPAQPPSYGLLVAAPTLDAGDLRWAAGVAFLPEGCGASGRGPIELCAGGASVDPGDSPAVVRSEAFAVWAGDRCGSVGIGSRDFAGRARRQLLATESFQAAAELWTGAVRTAVGSPARALVDSESDVVTGGPASVVAALGMVEAALGSCGQGRRGMVHVTPQVLTELVAADAVIRAGNLWTTAMGNVVVADAGYPGSGPGDVAPGATQWLYATSMLRVRLGPIDVVPEDLRLATDRLTNTTTVYALRPVLIEWDECCHVAAEVDVPYPLTGGAE